MAQKKNTKNTSPRQEIHNHHYSYDWTRDIQKIALILFSFLVAVSLLTNLVSLLSNNHSLKMAEINAEKTMFTECVDTCNNKKTYKNCNIQTVYDKKYTCIQACVEILHAPLTSYAKK